MLGNLTLGSDSYVDQNTGSYIRITDHPDEDRRIKVSNRRRKSWTPPSGDELLVYGTTLTLTDTFETSGVWESTLISISIDQSGNALRTYGATKVGQLAALFTDARLLSLYSGQR